MNAVVAAAERTDFTDRTAAGALLDALADLPRDPGSYDPATGEAVDPPTELLDYLEYVESGNG